MGKVFFIKFMVDSNARPVARLGPLGNLLVLVVPISKESGNVLYDEMVSVNRGDLKDDRKKRHLDKDKLKRGLKEYFGQRVPNKKLTIIPNYKKWIQLITYLGLI